MRTVHALINEAAEGRNQAYFGKDLPASVRPWSAAEMEAEFDPTIAIAAFFTPEVAINPQALARTLRECIAAHPLIEVRCSRTVVGAEEERDEIRVLSKGHDGSSQDRFDHVVNALWDGRLGLNEKLGFRANRPWLHRLKYGVSFRLPPDVPAIGDAPYFSGNYCAALSLALSCAIINCGLKPRRVQRLNSGLRSLVAASTRNLNRNQFVSTPVRLEPIIQALLQPRLTPSRPLSCGFQLSLTFEMQIESDRDAEDVVNRRTGCIV